jgi:hypothetical protein
MENNAIPVRASVLKDGSASDTPTQPRIIVCIGKHRVVFEIACKAIALAEAPDSPLVPMLDREHR